MQASEVEICKNLFIIDEARKKITLYTQVIELANNKIMELNNHQVKDQVMETPPKPKHCSLEEFVSYTLPSWSEQREARVFALILNHEQKHGQNVEPPVITRDMVTTPYEYQELMDYFGSKRFEIYIKGQIRYDDDELFSEMDHTPWSTCDANAECSCLTWPEAPGWVPCKACFMSDDDDDAEYEDSDSDDDCSY